jgi:ribonuclease BN (tRNA processing enzyme)
MHKGESTRAAAKSLDICFIDIEGGQSTLRVSPSGESLLIDMGFPGDGQSDPGDPAKERDANRILAAAHEAGIRAIDCLLITHFHPDHLGGVLELAQLIPIRHFVDHGYPTSDLMADTDYRPFFEKIREATQPLSTSRAEARGSATAEDSRCCGRQQRLQDPRHAAARRGNSQPRLSVRSTAPGHPMENPRSTGVVADFGRFRFLDVGDLSGQPQ